MLEPCIKYRVNSAKHLRVGGINRDLSPFHQILRRPDGEQVRIGAPLGVCPSNAPDELRQYN